MRKSEIVLVLSNILILVVVSCEGDNKYDYLQVVFQWPPATCSDLYKSPCHRNPPNRFGIHGMWPSLESGHIPICNGSPFNINQVSMLQPELSELWPNVVTGNNPWLWRHEWDKHGTCTEHTLFNQQNYFYFAINTYIWNDLLFDLFNNQITPNGHEYQREQIYAAIRARTGRTPAVRCNYNSYTGLEQLHEITICYNSDASALVDCPPIANQCSTSFVWYSWNSM